MFNDKRLSKYVILGTLLLLVLLGFLLFFGLNAQAAGKFLPIREVRSPGGLSVWLVEDHTLPVIALKFMFLDSGSALDPDRLQGLARMLSNTMDEGAGDMDSQIFQKALSDSSIALQFNASRDGFGGDIKTLTRNKEKAFDLLTLAMNNPRFDPEAIARMRDSNIARINSSLSEPDWMAARLINDRAFANHPYAMNSGGTLGGLAGITPDDLKAFKNSYLSKDRLLIAVAGDINPEELGPAIDKIFGALPVQAGGNRIEDTNISNPGKIYLFEKDIPQTMIEIMLPAFDHKDPDYYALQVMNYVYGGAGFGSRLMESAREKRGLTYGIYTTLLNYRHADALSISTSTKTKSTEEMLSIIRAEMIRLQTEKIDEKELSDAKSYITGSMPLALDSTEDIADVVLNLRGNGLPINYLDHFAENINAVTADDVQRVARRVLNPGSMVVVMVGKPENINDVQIVKELPNVQ